MNRDGKADLVVGNSNAGGGNLSVFLGKGDGTFTSAGSYDAGSDGILALGDFNGDGLVDIAAIRLGRFVDILPGNGDGSFRSPISYDVSQQGYSLAAADLNRDGKLDLVIATNYSFVVALGNGDGTFQAPVDHAIPSDLSTVFVTDFNNDGIPDIAVVGIRYYCSGGFAGSVGYELGKGDGTFGTLHSRKSPVQSPPFAAAVADINGDGVPDFLEVGGCTRSSVTLLLADVADSRLGFEPAEGYVAGFSETTPVIGDLNGDGAPDVLSPVGNGFDVLLNTSGVRVGLISSANPSTVGQAVTFTSTVTPTFASQGTPGGTVAFRDGKNLLATVSLASGTAAYTTSFLSAGKHTITPSYSGDSVFVPLTSQPLTQTVNK